MQHSTDTKFFTNEPERDLYSRFNVVLKNNTRYFDVLVGYFRTSGFFKLYACMENVEKIRILVGLNVDMKTIEYIETANNDLGIRTLKDIKDIYKTRVKKEFDFSDDSDEIEHAVRKFIEWIKSGKIQMRIYPESSLHAKVYIMRKDMSKDPEHFGSVITGSSNFSESGLSANLEFNVELKDKSDVEFALERFNELWDKSVNIEDEYVEAVTKETWINDTVTPYQIYLKTLYEYFMEEINSDKDDKFNDYLPEGYMRLQYQIDAVIQAKKILEGYGGVFISDVVGLGKTYICAMLAKNLRKGHNKLIICPPVLVDYWDYVMKEFDVVADIVSLGKLDKVLVDPKKLERYEYVFIDEVHRFRNSNTEGYTKLHQICKGKKIVLVSATPINNYSSDIENQLYLFQSKHQSNISPNIKNLEGFFGKMRTKLGKYPKNSIEYRIVIRENSQLIRDNLLRNVMIRRTRKEILEFYSDDFLSQGLRFPKLSFPNQVTYSFDQNTDKVFGETLKVIGNLDYSRYKPLHYLNDNRKFASMLVSQKNMSGFMKATLVKRLESSFFAFKMSLSRYISSYEKFIDMYLSGDIYISKKINVYDLLDNGDDEMLMELVEAEKVQHFKSEEFNTLFVMSLRRDLELLQKISKDWETITSDPKLDKLKSELDSNDILKNRKIIIFTESKETAKYLGNRLLETYGDRLVVFSGESSDRQKLEIEYSFNPKYDELRLDKFDILITTDVLAEGINLHKSNILINYDLPWNPTKIMQRSGRINRVGSSFDEIYIFNFFPTSQADAQLSLKQNIINKLQQFHDTLGEDMKFLSEDEEVSSHQLYELLTSDMDADSEEGTNKELLYLSEIRKIRDTNIELFEVIKKLPLKARSSKVDLNIIEESTITFIRKGYLKKFFLSGSGSSEVSFLDAIKLIKCNEKESVAGYTKGFFTQMNLNKKEFDKGELVVCEEALESVDSTGNDKKMIKILKALLNLKELTEFEYSRINEMIILWESGDIPSKLTKGILNDIKKIEDGFSAYDHIVKLIPLTYFNNKILKKDSSEYLRQVVLSLFIRTSKEQK